LGLEGLWAFMARLNMYITARKGKRYFIVLRIRYYVSGITYQVLRITKVRIND